MISGSSPTSAKEFSSCMVGEWWRRGLPPSFSPILDIPTPGAYWVLASPSMIGGVALDLSLGSFPRPSIGPLVAASTPDVRRPCPAAGMRSRNWFRGVPTEGLPGAGSPRREGRDERRRAADPLGEGA